MAQAPPVLGRGGELVSRDLLLGADIPQPELRPESPPSSVATPVTSAFAWICRQSPKRGSCSKLATCSMNDSGGSGLKKPERARSLLMTPVISAPNFWVSGESPRKFGSAIGKGWICPAVM